MRIQFAFVAIVGSPGNVSVQYLVYALNRLLFAKVVIFTAFH